MSFYLFLPLFSFLTLFFVWINVFSRKNKTETDQKFLWFSGCAGIWFFIIFLIYLPFPLAWISFLFRFASFFWLFTPFFFLLFFFSFIRKKITLFIRIVFTLSLISFFIACFTDFVFHAFQQTPYGPVFAPGTLTPFISLVNLLLPFSYAVIIFIKDSIKDRLIKKITFSVFFVLFLIYLSGSFIDFIFSYLTSSHIPQFGPLLLTFLILYLFQIEKKYRFLNPDKSDYLNEIFDNLKTGVILLNEEGIILDMNHKMRLLFQQRIPIDRFFSIYDLIPEYQKNHLKNFDIVFYDELKNRHSYLVNSIQIQKRQTLLTEILLFEDITEKKEIEKAFTQSESHYLNLFQNLKDGFLLGKILLDSSKIPVDFYFIDANAKSCEILEIPNNQLVLKKGSVLIEKESEFLNILELFSDCSMKGASLEFIYPYRNKDLSVLLYSPQPLYFGVLIKDHTEKIKLEKNLFNFQNQNEAILNAIPDMIFLLKKDGSIIDFKTQSRRELYTIPEYFIKKKLIEILPQKTADEAMFHIEKAFETKSISSFEYSLFFEESKEIHFFEARISPYSREEAIAMIRDISEDKKIEEKIRLSEKKYRELVETMNDILFILNENLVIEYLSPVFEKKIGDHSHPLTGRPLLDSICQDDKDLFMIQMKTLFLQSAVSFECRIEIKENSPHWVHLQLYLSEQKNHQFYIHGIMTDIQERKKTHEQLIQNEENFQKMIENISDIILTYNKDNKITYISSSVYRILGYQPKEIIGKYIKDLKSFFLEEPETRIFFLNTEENQEEIILYSEFKARHKNGTEKILEARGRHLSRDAKDWNAVISLRDITETKIMEQKLIFQSVILKNVQDFIVVTDLNSFITYWNEGAEKLSGYTASEIIGKHISIIWPPEDTLQMKHLHDEIYSGKEIRQELQILKKDKTKIWIDIKINFIQNSEGHKSGTIGIAKDISEKKQALELLLQSEKRFREIAELSPMFIGEADLQGTVLYANPFFLSTYGYTEKDISEKKLFISSIYPDEKEKNKAFRSLQKHLESSEHPFEELKTVNKDGKIIFMLGTASPVSDKEKVCGFRLIGIDISEKKKMEADLKTAELFYKTLFNEFPYGLVLADFETLHPIEFNRVACRQLEYEADEFDHLTASDYDIRFSKDEIEKNKKKLPEIMSSSFETRHKTKNGNIRDVAVSTRYLELFGKKIILSIHQDITEQKKLREELIRSNQELKQFAYISSHDLREPLRMVSSYLKLIEKRYASHFDQNGLEFIGYAVEGAKRMDSLMQSLLAFSKLDQKIELTPVDLNEIVKITLKNLEVLIKDNEPEIILESLPMILGDKIQLVQVFQNLIHNALKFRKKEEKPFLKISVQSNQEHWIISIEDHGIGISKEYFEKIFVLFQRLHQRSEYEGSGIGLAISKKIIEKHQGKITLESEPDKGATFFIELPKIKEA
ncbi:MAG TPA: hypothetical protein DHW82_06865 [Spirochaetia bacterium]|nr:MAG: hypothetical protein A2Y41_05355 [Spirochaetes bacterium GWB1_36_13]HCL56716.1 hypothetical protein [Spirochaetia bacterium]